MSKIVYHMKFPITAAALTCTAQNVQTDRQTDRQTDFAPYSVAVAQMPLVMNRHRL